jgi:hypothetical protein
VGWYGRVALLLGAIAPMTPLGGVGGFAVWGLASLLLADALRRIPLERWYGLEQAAAGEASPIARVEQPAASSARAHAIF